MVNLNQLYPVAGAQLELSPYTGSPDNGVTVAFSTKNALSTSIDVEAKIEGSNGATDTYTASFDLVANPAHNRPSDPGFAASGGGKISTGQYTALKVFSVTVTEQPEGVVNSF